MSQSFFPAGALFSAEVLSLLHSWQSLVIAAWWLGASYSTPQALHLRDNPCNFQLALAFLTCLSKVSWRANVSGHSGHLNVLLSLCISLMWRVKEPLVENSLSHIEHLCLSCRWMLFIWHCIVSFLANVLWHSGHGVWGIVRGKYSAVMLNYREHKPL